MKITWLGHSGFRIEIAGQVLLVDPWLTGNPSFEGQDRAAAIGGATCVLLSHGHGDHAGDAEGISKELGIPVACIHELSNWLGQKDGVETVGFGKGGTISLGDVQVTMVNAVHSSSVDFAEGPTGYAGGEAGFIISGDGHTIYFSGDTDVTTDMQIWHDLHRPDIGILCVGGHYTMDQNRAIYACRKFFDFKTVIPCHYKTFPLLAQDVEELKAGLPGVQVVEAEVMRPFDL
ncbi:metal-dependent hydrolase [Halovulum sp. GXIMD14794]